MDILVNNDHVFTLYFANDQLVMAEDEEYTGWIIRKFEQTFKEELQINVNKILAFDSRQQYCNRPVAKVQRIKGVENILGRLTCE